MSDLKNRVYHGLRFLERYTKTDMIYATRSGFWLMSNQVFAAAVSFILSIIFANFLSKEVFGIYRYIVGMAGIATAFSLTGINSAVTIATAQGYDGALKQSLKVQAKWAIPQLLFSLVLGIYYLINHNIPYAVCFFIIAIASPLAGITNTYGAFLNGKKDFQTSTYYGLSSNAWYFVIMAAVSIFYPNIIALIAAYFVSGLLANLYFLWRTLAKYPKNNDLSRPEDITYAKKLSWMNIAGSVAQHIDGIVVYHFLGAANLAIYSFATVIPERIRTMFGAISTAAFPKLAEKSETTEWGKVKSQGLISKVVRLVGLAAVIILFYILAAPYIYDWFFPQYQSSVLYSQVFALSILAIASNIPVPALFAEKRQGGLYLINVGLPTTKILVSIVAIIIWGIWGAIFAKILHYVLHLVLSSFLAVRPTQSHQHE